MSWQSKRCLMSKHERLVLGICMGLASTTWTRLSWWRQRCADKVRVIWYESVSSLFCRNWTRCFWWGSGSTVKASATTTKLIMDASLSSIKWKSLDFINKYGQDTWSAKLRVEWMDWHQWVSQLFQYSASLGIAKSMVREGMWHVSGSSSAIDNIVACWMLDVVMRSRLSILISQCCVVPMVANFQRKLKL